MEELMKFMATLLFYFVLAYVIICILLSVGCAPAAPPFMWPNSEASFQAYLNSGEHQRIMHQLRQDYGNCLIEMMMGEDVRCGDRPGWRNE